MALYPTSPTFRGDGPWPPQRQRIERLCRILPTRHLGVYTLFILIDAKLDDGMILTLLFVTVIGGRRFQRESSILSELQRDAFCRVCALYNRAMSRVLSFLDAKSLKQLQVYIYNVFPPSER